MKPTADEGATESGSEPSFSRYEEKFWALRGKLSAGRLSRKEFDAGVAELEVQDSAGKVWRIDPDEGAWLLFKNNQWIEADPYGAVTDAPAVEQSEAREAGDHVESASPTSQQGTDESASGAPPADPMPGFQRVQPEHDQDACLDKVPRESAPPVTCQACGAAIKEGKKFCVKCGAKAAPEVLTSTGQASSESQERIRLTFDSDPLPPPSSGGWRHVFGGVKARTDAGGAAAKEADRAASGSCIKQSEIDETEPAEPPLPPSDQTWGFQDKLTEIAAKTIAAIEQSGLSSRTGLGGMLNRMIRASLLDKTIYREVAANRSLQNEAWQVMILVVILSSGGVLLASMRQLSLSLLYSIVPTAVLQIMAILARIWVTQAVASSWIKTPTHFNQFFRALVYAQSPASLQIVPVVGQFIGLWSIITSTAAIRDVTGCSTKNAAILAIVSIAGAMVAVSLASPFVRTLLAWF